VDCSESDVRVLEFDHLGDKLADVSALVRASSLAKIQAEVAKCDVVCANCHRIRTRTRVGDYRHRAWLAAGDLHAETGLESGRTGCGGGHDAAV